MSRQPLKKTKLSSLVRHDRPSTTLRIANVREVRFSTRGHVLEQRSRPIESRWHNWAAKDNEELGLDGYDENWELEPASALPAHEPGATLDEKGKRKRSQTAARPSIVWSKNYRSRYLDELLRWEGTLGLSKTCADCKALSAHYRCDECNDPAMVCQKCCVDRHKHNPFHMIKRWNTSFFRKAGLKELGLVIQLGHMGGQCANPHNAPIDFTVLHTTGQHLVSLKFCRCPNAHPDHMQLLHQRLYPATQAKPKTCATFTLLDFLHILSLSTQGSTQDMYRTLVRLNDNTGLIGSRSCYKQLIRMLHQYRHLKLMKRGGRGHIENGINSTLPGDLALQCPTCPHKHTLQDGWENLSSDQQYLNRFWEAVDGNFKLKNIFASSWLADPGFGNGMAYMIPNEQLVEHIATNSSKIDEVSTCVDFDAIKRALTKNGGSGGTGVQKPKFRATGVVGASCARSEMLTPNGVGDLQYGERYINVDLVVGYSLRSFAFLSVLFISYDIVCQWLVNFWKRMPDWPEELKLDPLTTNVRGCIPKFHFNAHNALGHSQFSFHRVPGSAEIDGECCERIWDGTNALGKTTRTMGPGMRSDTLDDHFGFWNWKKYTGIGKALKQRYRVAVYTRNYMKASHEGFTANLPPESIAKWTLEIIAWEELINTMQPKHLKSPYDSDEAVLSDARLRHLMDTEEAQAVKEGAMRVHSIGPAKFVVQGLDIEESQRRLAWDIAQKTAGTETQHSSILERRNALSLRITSWAELRSTYLPGLPLYRDHQSKKERATPTTFHDSGSSNITAVVDETCDEFPEDNQLFLPSSIPPSFRARVCTVETIDAEKRMRIAQMTDCIVHIRRSIRIRTRMIRWKNRNITGQHHGTRSRGIVDRMSARLKNLEAKYGIARTALLSLDSSSEWQEIWQELKPSDIVSYADTELNVTDAEKHMSRGTVTRDAEKHISRGTVTGETRKKLSWIWTTTAGINGVAGNEGDQHSGFEGLDETMKVEWLKSRRRWLGWVEACELLSVEMGRALRFLEAKSALWISRQSSRSTPSANLSEGIRAYALRQADLQEAFAETFARDFEKALESEDGSAKKLVAGNILDDDDYTPEDDEAIDDQ